MSAKKMEKTAEKIAEENERRIAQFTNIDKESFTHSFRGISITIGAGQSYMGRFPEADHLATHLARKIIARAKKAAGADKDPKGSVLWTDEEINVLKAKILTEVGTETRETMTKEEQRKQDLERISQKFEKKKPVEVTKADVIKDLKARGVEVNINKSKEELLEQLMELEAQK